jgi:hypothetical protein
MIKFNGWRFSYLVLLQFYFIFSSGECCFRLAYPSDALVTGMNDILPKVLWKKAARGSHLAHGLSLI